MGLTLFTSLLPVSLPELMPDLVRWTWDQKGSRHSVSSMLFFSQGWNQERNLVIFHEFWKDNLKSYSTKQETAEKLMTIRKLSLFLALEPTMYTGSTDIWSSCCFIIIIPFRITLLCFFLPSYSLNHSASMLFLSSPLFLLLLHYQSYYKSKLKFQISGNF